MHDRVKFLRFEVLIAKQMFDQSVKGINISQDAMVYRDAFDDIRTELMNAYVAELGSKQVRKNDYRKMSPMG